jgi:hypothetical protein
MNITRIILILVALIITWRISLGVSNAGITLLITVNGTYDEAAETAITAHNGLTGIGGIHNGTGIIWGDPIWVPTGEVDSDGNPIEEEITPELYRCTYYQVTVPDSWIGNSVCFSVDGENWSALHLVLTGHGTQNFEFQNDQVGASPWSGTVNNPATNFSELGNLIAVGKLWNDSQQNAFNVTAWDNGISSWPAVGLDIRASAPNAYWRWMHYPGYIAMELDYLHRLTLRKPGPEGLGATGSRIVIDPNLNRIMIGDYPVLTTAGANTLYVSRSASGINMAYNGLVHSQSGMQPQVVLGRYNDDRVNVQGENKTKGVLVVGTGTGTGTEPRKNGLRILDDGTVLILEKGDLSMGTFDEGPTP